jgi:hypothetical protein
MALFGSLMGARKSGAMALFRRHAAVPSPALIDKVARCYIAVALVAYLVDLLRQTRDGLTDGMGRPFGDDFINFWSGPFLAWHQRSAEIYNFSAFHAFEQSVVGASLMGYHYSYPPALLVLTAPLALIPYSRACALAMRRVVRVLSRAPRRHAGRPHAVAGAGHAGGPRQRHRRTERNLDRGAVRRRTRPA